jgi:glycosyltransferase involved in cell wall biosynthesis
MLIAYLVHINFGLKSGVSKKIIAQADQWRRLGQQVDLFVVTRDEEVARAFKHERVFRYKNTISERLAAFKQAESEILRKKYQLLYTRQDMYYPSTHRLSQRMPYVVEVNTDEVEELRQYSKAQWVYSLLTRGIILKNIAGFVFVTEELSQRPTFAHFRKPYKVIANGIDLENFVPNDPVANKNPRIVFIGQANMAWHGTEKLVPLAKHCPDWQFDIIGLDRPEEAMPNNMIFHGSMQRSEYEPLLSGADCAVGSLALHSKGMDEASPLKTREYLANGLPVILGYKDTDFPAGADFLLQLPNTESNVEDNLDSIREFVEQWKGKRVNRDQIRHISYASKEKTRLEFFETCISDFKP